MISKDTLTPLRTIFGYLLAISAVVILVSYTIIQARLLLVGPEIIITNELSQIQNQRHIMVEGEARNIAYLTLNGRRIYTDRQGSFSEELVLENGYTIMTLRAADRYGRETKIEKNFVFIPASLSLIN